MGLNEDFRKEFIEELVQDALDAAVDFGYALSQQIGVHNLQVAEEHFGITTERLYKALELKPKAIRDLLNQIKDVSEE